MTPAPGNPPPPGAGPVAASGGDAGRWREAARLRHDHSGWTVIWLAPAAEFRAYRRLPRTRRDTALADPTADGLAAQITAAEQTTRPPPPSTRVDMADRRPRPRRTSAHRIRVTAAELASAGLAAGVLQTRDVLDVTASLREPGRKDVEVIVDEDLYVEVWVLESAGRYRRAGHLGHPAGAGRDHRSVMTSPC